MEPVLLYYKTFSKETAASKYSKTRPRAQNSTLLVEPQKAKEVCGIDIQGGTLLKRGWKGGLNS